MTGIAGGLRTCEDTAAETSATRCSHGTGAR